MKTFTVKIPEELLKKIEATAKQNGKTKSQFVRQAIEKFLNNNSEAEELSFFDIAKDLAGSVEGPEDLSSNPKHMEGFDS